MSSPRLGDIVWLAPTGTVNEVKDPRTKQPLPDRGKRVEFDLYWSRRWSLGEVKATEPPQPAPEKPEKTTTTTKKATA